MIDRNKYESLADALASVDDLEAVKRALIKEATVREVMRESGEDRKTVTDMIDAMGSMGQEAVLDLTEGEPTTLAEALSRYLEALDASPNDVETVPLTQVTDALSALLAYPWPDSPAPADAVLTLDSPDDETLIISVGGVEVATVNHDEHGWAGMDAARTVAEGVHRALLAALRAKP